MKFLTSQLAWLTHNRLARRNVAMLVRFMGILAALVAVFSVAFHFIMEYEGRGGEHSWLTGLYWTLTVMSTLGFGDITFHSDLGRLFSIVVLGSGIVFLMVLLPFTFIQFFFAPWMEAQASSRAPRELPEEEKGHVIVTQLDPVTRALIAKLTQYGIPYVLLVPELQEALRLHDEGFRVVLGNWDDPQTYRNVRVGRAALVAATGSDASNTNVAFTVREISATTPVIVTADKAASIDILTMAGATTVMHLPESMGQLLARRAKGFDAIAHPIGQFGKLVVAEATVGETPLCGVTVKESRLRETAGVTVAGLWEHGRFVAAMPDTVIHRNTVLVLAGDESQLQAFDEMYLIHHVANLSEAPAIIIGAGRVGRATARALKARGIASVIVERDRSRFPDDPLIVRGDAAELAVLESAGIHETPTVIISTHDDDINIYLALYCRRLRPDVQIICRATLERNVATMHRAGADFVMSYSSMGAETIFNELEGADVFMVAEGLNVFRVRASDRLAGLTLVESAIRPRTGCSVVAAGTGDGQTVNPPPGHRMAAGDELVLVGTREAEQKFLDEFGKG